MIWVCALVFIVVCLAAIEWTSRPRKRAKEEPAAELQQRIPQPRKPAGDRSVHFTRRLP